MNTKRLLALLLTLCMVFSLAVPSVAFAEDEETALLVEEGTPAETQDETPVIEEQPEETTQTPVVEEIIEENEQPAESVTDENEQPAGNTDETQTPEQPDENEQPALASLEAQEVAQLGMGGAVASLEEPEVAQLGDPTVMTPSDFINAIANETEYSKTVTVKFTNDNVPSGNNHGNDGYQIYLLGGFDPLRSTPITISNVTFDASEYTGNNVGIQLYLYTSADVTFTNCTFNKVGVSFDGAEDKSPKSNVSATFTNCSFSDFDNYAIKYVRNATITGCTFANCKRAVMAYSHHDDDVLQTLNISGNTFNGMVEDRIIKLYNLVTDSNSSITVQNNTLNNCTAKLFQVTKDNGCAVNSHYKILGTNTGVTAENLSETDYIPLYIEGNYYVDVLSAAVAQIGSTKYATLADAIADVEDNGTATIQMIADSAETEPVKNDKGAYTYYLNHVMWVKAGQNITLDLNGHTVSYETDALPLYFIVNEGTLTVKDTSANANGKITLTAGVDSGYGKETTTIYNHGGTLNLQSGIIENASNGGAAYAVDNSSNSWNTGNALSSVFNMTGGQLSGARTDNTLRVYQNTSTTSIKWTNQVNISGGTLDNGIFVDTVVYQPTTAYTGDNIEIDINISDNAIVNGLIDLKLRHHFNTSLDITGGTFNNAALRVRKASSEWNANVSEKAEPLVHISGGQFSFANGKAFAMNYGYSGTDWTTLEKPYYVSGGLFNVDLNSFNGIQFPDGMTGVASDNATYPYTVGNVAPTYVAQIGDTGYETLAAAIAAANEADSAVTIKLLADCDTGDHTMSNPLVLTKAGATLDLNGKTITVNNNFSFVMQGNEITVTNGSLISAPNAAKKTNLNSYILVINDCDGVNLSNLTMQGGLSIGGSQDDWGTGAGAAKNVTIEDCNITSGDYYAVCSQMGSDAKIVSGTYISNQTTVNAKVGILSPAVIYGRFVGSDGPEGYITVTGGNFQGNIGVANKDWIVLKGGTYTVEPADGLVADGYAAVQVGSVWKVGKVTIGDITSPTISEETNEATYTVPFTVKDGDDTIETGTAQNIKVSVDATNDAANTKLSQISGLDNVVAAAVENAGAQASSVTDIKVAVKSTVQTSALSALTYEVHPEAIAYVDNAPVGDAVVITNTQIKAGSTFTFRLDVTSLGVGVGGMVTATHHSEDDSFPDETNTYNVKSDDNGTTKYITVTTTHFSTWTLSEKSADDAVATYTLAGTTYYTDNLADAFANVEAGGTVKLLENIELTKAIDVDKQVTLDTNGKNITHAASGYTQDYLIGVKYGGDLTIKNNDSHFAEGWILASASNVYCAIKMTLAGETYTGTPAKLTVDASAGAIKGYYYGISGNGSRNGTEITINGGAITGGDVDNGTRGCGIYHPQNGTLTINSGTINGGETAVEMRAGTLNISGGLFTAIATPTATNPNGSGTTSSGAAIAIAQHTTKQPINVTITGGEFRGYSAFYESNPQNNGVSDIEKISLSITGGEFKAVNGGSVAVYSEDAAANKINGFISGGSFSSIVENEYCANGYIPKTEKVDGMYNVTEGYKISFDLSGATGTMQTQTVVKGNSFTVPGLAEGVTAPANKEFDGWTLDSTAYAAGESFTPTGDVTLTAKWKDAGTGGNAGYLQTTNADIRASLLWNVYFHIDTDVISDPVSSANIVVTSAYDDEINNVSYPLKYDNTRDAYYITVPIRHRLINQEVGFTLKSNGTTYTLRFGPSGATDYTTVLYSFNQYLTAIEGQEASVVAGLRAYSQVLLNRWPVNG